MTLSVLLPAVSPCTSHDAREKYVANLLSAMQGFLQNNPASNVICGMDAHDSASEIADKLAASTNRLRVRCYTFKIRRFTRPNKLSWPRLLPLDGRTL